MTIADPRIQKRSQPKETVIFAAGQLQGQRDLQEDRFLNFSDECFVIADGVGGMPHGEVAATIACETAIWGYKHIRQRRCYWLNKKQFMHRIFRSTNLAVWQKHRETGFGDGLASTLLVLIVGAETLWIGSAGDSNAFFFRNGMVQKLTHEDVDAVGNLTKALGLKRLGLMPQFIREDFFVHDVILLATDGVSDYVTTNDLMMIMSSAGSTAETVKSAVDSLIQIAEENGSKDNMTACLIKRASVVGQSVLSSDSMI
ncbi:protein phosphatase 2C domain-containing protein [Patescibacteria group bacterium]|nr:protein phosphatase 2C domain-containing protein [Patescibacteria group bacterium]MBU1473055.1 protein phosphatase 2C domain-containing protein [Patescibacteria group bacterium]MBU2460189.1 protein phosphatase 2C domain-containing protein [Patescibacteria group bacterium]MBU2543924.1 protein phosphatase 2C domain-containing protein [Patescibacteria group bacterium]